MTGSIDYALTFANTEQSVAQINGVNSALKNMERTAAGLAVPTGTAVFSKAMQDVFYITPNAGLATQLNRISGGAGNATRSVNELGRASKALQTSVTLATNASLLMGDALGVKVATSASVAIGSMQAVKATAIAMGVGIGTATTAVVAGVAVIWTMVEAGRALYAVNQYQKGIVTPLESEYSRGTALLEKFGSQLNPKHVKTYSDALREAFDAKDVDYMAGIIKRMTTEMKGIVLPKYSTEMGDQRAALAGWVQRLEADSMAPGLERDLAQFEISRWDKWKEMQKLAKDSGIDLTDTDKQRFAKAMEVQEAAIYEENKEKDKTKVLGAPTVSAWEKIGAIIGGGGNDPSKQTANNTRVLVDQVKLTNKLLSNRAGGELVNN